MGQLARRLQLVERRAAALVAPRWPILVLYCTERTGAPPAWWDPWAHSAPGALAVSYPGPCPPDCPACLLAATNEDVC